MNNFLNKKTKENHLRHVYPTFTLFDFFCLFIILLDGILRLWARQDQPKLGFLMVFMVLVNPNIFLIKTIRIVFSYNDTVLLSKHCALACQI